MMKRIRGAKADATRKQLLDAAAQVIGEKGYSAATVDQIVKVAGVSKGVAYYHFKNKAALAESILEEGVGQIVEGFERICAEAPAADKALMGMIELFASRAFGNKAFGRFLMAELWREGRAWSDAMRVHEARLLHLLEEQLVRGQREGIFRPEIDPAFEAVALVGMVLTTTMYYVGEGGPITGSRAIAPAAAALHEDDDLMKNAFVTHICDLVQHANKVECSTGD
ncbi:TetR/AcrR family transcriptional regulator [Adlercreutzia sp. ZJ141]|uniref:TetR/AcrR family transcriptional regulator n=1 Tax=Adlercreutzia sp. ZJ141 TaxID=2709406 RepID=UPI001F1555F5|nr:TetR/AcrR family transcriptional regulator [Adlercreutzia sp. ZJ141]